MKKLGLFFLALLIALTSFTFTKPQYEVRASQMYTANISTSVNSTASRCYSPDTFVVGNDGWIGDGRFGMAFAYDNITIPFGATISSAYLHIKAWETDADTVVNVKILVSPFTDYVPFTTKTMYDFNRTNAATANMTVDWDNVEAWTALSFYDSPDFSELVQALVNSTQWDSGTSDATITIFVDDYDARSYEGNSPIQLRRISTAELIIEYNPSPLTVLTASATLLNSGYLSFIGQLTNIDTTVTNVGFQNALYADEYTSSFSNSTVSYTSLQNFSTQILPTDLGLVKGETYKVRAFATDNDTTAYGQDYVYEYVGQIAATTIGVTQTSISGTPTFIFTGSIDDSASVRGFEIGTSSGVYNNNLKLEELANSGGSWNGSSGQYALTSTQLTSNTTYYYRAYTGIFTSSYTWIYGYGEEKSFTTTTTQYTDSTPVIQTSSAIYLQNGLLQMSGSIISSGIGIIERGFRFGTTIALGSSSSDIADSFPFGQYSKSTSFTSGGGLPYPSGSIIYVQAYAVNSLGTYGYGSIIQYTIPQWNIGVGGIYVVNNGVTPNGNTVLLSATITNPSNVQLTRYAFAWGTTVSASDSSINTPISGTSPTQISYSLSALAQNTVYFFRAGVYADNAWIWSDATSFTTGQTIPIFTGEIPAVVTLAATNIGSNNFKANGNLISIGSTLGSYVSQLGFAYSFDTNTPVSTWTQSLTTGNFSIGAFDKTLSFSETGLTVYYCSVAVNQYGTAFGSVFFVNMNTSTSSGNTTSTPQTGNVAGGISSLILQIARYQGLDNDLGHWAFLLETMVVIAFFFGMIMIAMAVYHIDENAIKSVAWILLVAEVVDFGAFLFTGWLGMWPLVFLGGIVLIIVLWIIIKFKSGGG